MDGEGTSLGGRVGALSATGLGRRGCLHCTHKLLSCAVEGVWHIVVPCITPTKTDCLYIVALEDGALDVISTLLLLHGCPLPHVFDGIMYVHI